MSIGVPRWSSAAEAAAAILEKSLCRQASSVAGFALILDGSSIGSRQNAVQLKGLGMRVQYFEDTDTLYLVFKESEIAETKDLDGNTLVEFGAGGNLVSMTIEHARHRADVAEFSYSRVPAMKPVA